MDTPAISIIVPVYNMERYLKECLDSIKAQDFKNWECILVNDGSTDSSPSICDDYAAQDTRFKVIHKKNGGLSSARNAALKKASADYIGFVDADDWIEPNMYELLFNLIKENDADIAQTGYWNEYRGRKSTKHITSSTKIIDGASAMHEIGFDRLPNYVWNKLHHRRIINCEFPEGRNFEDIFVYGQWLRNVRKMVLDPTPTYHYRMRSGSIVHTDAAKNRYDYFLSCIDRMKMVENIMGKNTDQELIRAYIHKSGVNACKIIARQEKDITKRNQAIDRIKQQLTAFPLPGIKYLSLKQWWRAKLLLASPRVFTMILKGVHILDLDTKYRQAHFYE